MKNKRQNLVGKLITLLLAVQILLIGLRGFARIEQSGSTLEVLIWMIQQYIPVLTQIRRLEDKEEKSDQEEKSDPNKKKGKR